jgi:phosphopantothenoylcysteine decarboxylase/phosphopantothenate--cysteine ligase
MRVLTNTSTGEMGRLLLKALQDRGASVTLLEGPVALPPPGGPVRYKKFYYYDDLEKILKSELKGRYHCVIHAAAVSDFVPRNTVKGKLSSGRPFCLALRPARKMVNWIKREAGDTFLVGYKLETSLARPFILSKTRDLFTKARCDLVVANTVTTAGYKACLVSPDGRISFRSFSKKDIVKAIAGRLDQYFNDQ